MPVPIVFIHQGESWYLWYTLRQAMEWNPGAEIVLITNAPNGTYPAGVRTVAIDSYRASADSFAQVYQHHSTNAHAFELFSFQRWFVLLEWMRQNGVERCFYQDSDVMLYTNIEHEFRRLGSFGLSVVKRKGPQSMFIGERAALEQFCGFVTDTYSNHADTLARRYEEYKASNRWGGICDMTLLEDFSQQPERRVIDLFPIRDASTYDNNVNYPEGYEFASTTKRFVWRDKQPFGRHIESGKLVRFHAIHCQGAAKALIPDYATRKDRAYYQQFVFRTPWKITAVRMLRKVVRPWTRSLALPSVLSS